jgi:Na+:H+ antiporter, NhaA family
MNPTKTLYSRELIGGILLFAAALLAIIAANSSLSDWYSLLLDTPFEVRLGSKSLNKPLLLWINDGLMVIFFLMIALEVKREFLEGDLSSPSQIALPAIGALGGMIMPAIVYTFFNHNHSEYMHGWAIPTATDIAFVLGMLSILGRRVPTALRIFLLSLAIFDDIGAIVIIAIFYSHELSMVALTAAIALIGVLFTLNRLKVTSLMPYALLGLLMWLFVLKSGVHATLTGVVLGLMIPHKGHSHEESPLKRMEYALHPYVTFLIVPIFAFTNAGVNLTGLSTQDFVHPVTLGVALGLLIGKQLGIASFVWVAIQLRLAQLPRNTTWMAMYGGCILSGIGFTMSLFIASLAFTPGSMGNFSADKLGILLGSVSSGVLGYLMLRYSHSRSKQSPSDEAFVEEYSSKP